MIYERNSSARKQFTIQFITLLYWNWLQKPWWSVLWSGCETFDWWQRWVNKPFQHSNTNKYSWTSDYLIGLIHAENLRKESRLCVNTFHKRKLNFWNQLGQRQTNCWWWGRKWEDIWQQFYRNDSPCRWWPGIFLPFNRSNMAQAAIGDVNS